MSHSGRHRLLMVLAAGCFSLAIVGLIVRQYSPIAPHQPNGKSDELTNESSKDRQITREASRRWEGASIDLKTALDTNFANLPASRQIVLPNVRLSPFQETVGAARYVGAAVCSECHDGDAEGYHHTNHARAFRPVDVSNEPADSEFIHVATGRHYRVYRQGGELRHREMLLDNNGEQIVLADHPLLYSVGSGHVAYTYLADINGFLMESPITWYGHSQEWNMSPGYETNSCGFARPVYLECLRCHTGRTRSLDGGHSRFQIDVMTIDCERCHGPGSRHVELRQSGAAASVPDWTIVHPGRLPREQNEAICASCHLKSAAESLVSGRTMEEFQPGHFLSDFRVDYAATDPDDSVRVVGHVEQLRQSRCYTASKTLTCVTCHDPHGESPDIDPVQRYRSQCLSCHGEETCGLTMADRLFKSPRDSCHECHMPRGDTQIPHVASHHHRIGVHVTKAVGVGRDQALTLQPVSDVSHLPKDEQQRCLALAYISMSQKTPQPQLSRNYLDRARAILEPLFLTGIHEPETLAALAQTQLRRDPQTAIQLAQYALSRGVEIPPDVEARLQFTLSDSHLALRQLRLAIEPLEKLVKLRQEAADWFLLAVCQFDAGDIPRALKSAERAVAIRPDLANYQALLAELLQRANRPTEAMQHQKLAKMLNLQRGKSSDK